MEFLQRALDDTFARIRAGNVFEKHGFTIVFFASGLAAARALTASLRLEDFADRPIGAAATQSVSAAARTGLFTQCIVVFLATALVTAWCLPKLERRAGEQALRTLEALSMAGLALLLLTVCRVMLPGSMIVLLVAMALTIGLALWDRRGGRTEITDRGAYTAWIAATSLALLPIVYDVIGQRLPVGAWVVPLLIGAGALALDIARRIVTAGRGAEDRARAHDRFVFALTPLAALAAFSVLQDELYLLLNHNDILWIRPRFVGLALVLGIFVWIGVRAVRGPRSIAGERLDLQRHLAFFTFPWIVGGLTAMFGFAATLPPTPDFLEPANAGLLIQQWHDFGRVPFIETFSSHGLHDSFFGFVYTALNGFGESWMLYDYLFGVLASLICYHVLRGILGNPIAAFFCVFALPYLEVLFPYYCLHVAISVFVAAWAVRQRTALAWFWFFAWTMFAFLWRLDMGFANAIASAGALAATLVLVPEYRPPWSAIVRGGAALFAVVLVLVLGVCRARHVDPWLLASDFRSIVTSNQAFAFPSIAFDKTDIVLFHVYVLPISVMLLFVALFVRLRGRVDLGSQGFFLALACAYFSVYYFANYPRGLVRHSFLEKGNTMLSSFGFLVLASAPYWLLGERKRLLAFGGFLLASGALCFNVDPATYERRPTPRRSNRLERTVLGLSTYRHVAYSPQRIDRSLAPDWFAPWNTELIVPFLESELEGDETFLDLSNSPLLYYHTHRVSPHYQNHTLLVYGDAMQERFLEELRPYDIPFVVLSMQEETGREYPPLHLDLDGVPYSLRHYRLREWVAEHYDPYVTLQRFQVWIRKDRLTKAAPPAETKAVLLAWNPSDAPMPEWSGTDPLVVRIAPKEARAIGPRPALSAQNTLYVRLVGRSDVESSVRVVWTVEAANAAREREDRTFTLPAGRSERFLALPGSVEARALVDLSVDPGAGFQLEAVELVSATSGPGSKAILGSQSMERTDLGDIAFLWGARDSSGAEMPVLRELHGADFETLHYDTRIVDRDDDGFKNGVGIGRASVCVDESKVRPSARFGIGDRVLTPRGGRRTIVGFGPGTSGPPENDRRELLFDGDPLDSARDGAPGLVRLALRAAAADAMTEIPEASRVAPETSRLFAFDPLPTRAGGTELVLDVRRASPVPRRVLVAFGQGTEKKGEFSFTLQKDDATHAYHVRLSSQYNWTRLPCDWLTVTGEGGAIDILGARLVAGD